MRRHCKRSNAINRRCRASTGIINGSSEVASGSAPALPALPLALAVFMAALGLVLLANDAAQASQAGRQWYHGTWNCVLDGRATKMRWSVRTARRSGDCRFDTKLRERVCTSESGVKTGGEFWDKGAWKSLTLQRASGQTINFRHADGNAWFLRSRGSSADGWSTWRQRRYPLTCRR